MRTLDEFQYIRFKRDHDVLYAIIDRPELLNAINAELHTEIADLFPAVAADGCAVLVLTGAGRAFSAGGDFEWMEEAIEAPERFQNSTQEGRQIICRLLDLDKPVVCQLNGDAVGFGATLALFCDWIIAAEDARIGDPHVRVGLVAGDGGAIIWPQLIGYAKAKRYLLSGDLLSAHEAERIGLVSEVVPAHELDERAARVAHKLAAGATQAIRWTKQLVNLPLKKLVEQHYDAGVEFENLSQLSADHRLAVAALRSGSKPRFGKDRDNPS